MTEMDTCPIMPHAESDESRYASDESRYAQVRSLGMPPCTLDTREESARACAQAESA